jgi:hypothetical protein
MEHTDGVQTRLSGILGYQSRLDELANEIVDEALGKNRIFEHPDDLSSCPNGTCMDDESWHFWSPFCLPNYANMNL